MKSYKEEGFILALKQLKEADKLAVIWTKNHGKQPFIMQGANKLLSRKSPALDTMNYVSFGAYPSKTGMDLITEVALLDDFASLKQDFGSISMLLYLAELLDKVLTEDNSYYDFFNWFNLYLQRAGTQKVFDLHFLLYGQLKLMKEIGFSPLLDVCASCFEPFESNTARIINLTDEPGYLCHKHISLTEQSDLISDTILKIQRYYNSCEIEAVLKLNFSAKISLQLFNIHNFWIENILNTEIKSKNLLLKWMIQKI